MKRLFLASAVSEVASDVAKKIKCKGLKLAFILTASEVEKGDLWWLRADREALVRMGFDLFDYTLTNKTKTDVKKDLEKADVLFFSGGNTFYLLQKIQESDSSEVIKNIIEEGKIYIGSSAGSIIAGPDIYPVRFADDIKMAPKLKGYKGFVLVDFITLPHWGHEDFKKAYLNGLIESIYNNEHKTILLTNYQYIEVKDDTYKIEEVKHN
jgi:dipeptidase E